MTAILLVGLVATGCASGPQKLDMKIPDSTGVARDAYVAPKTVADSLDRSTTVLQIGIATGNENPDRSKELVQIGMEVITGGRVVAQMLTETVSNSTALGIQGYFGKEVAKIYSAGQKCPATAVYCNSSVTQLQALGGNSAAQSLADSNSAATMDVNTGPRTAPPPLPPLKD